MKIIMTIIATALLTTWGTYQVVIANDHRDEFSQIQMKLKKLEENQEAMQKSSVDKFAIDDLSLQLKSVGCGPLADTVNLEDGTIYGVSIDAKAEEFLKLKCVRSNDLARLKNKIEKNDSINFGLKVSGPIDHPLSSSPFFWIFSAKNESKKPYRRIEIDGINSGKIRPIGSNWSDLYIKDFDDFLNKPQYISKTELTKRIEDGGRFVYHTRMYSAKYGCIIVDFGNDAGKFEYQSAKHILITNSLCEKEKDNVLDKPKTKYF